MSDRFPRSFPSVLAFSVTCAAALAPSLASANGRASREPAPLGAASGGGPSASALRLAVPEVQFASAAGSAVESAAPLQIEVVLSVPATAPVSVPFTLSGSATELVDYTIAAPPLVIAAGASSGFLDLTPIDDAAVEGRETLVVTLGAPSGGTLGAVTAHTFTLVDDEPAAAVQFALSLSQVSENAGPAALDVALSSPLTEDTLVTFSLSGTATPGADFSAAASPLIIPAGQVAASLAVTPIDDPHVEGTERAYFTLDAVDNGALGATLVHELQLLDDETMPSVEFAANQSTYAEGAGLVSRTLVLSDAPASSVTIPFSVGGTASHPNDYTVPPSPVVVPAGVTSVAFDVGLVNDTSPESSEDAVITLGTPTGASLGALRAHALTILDDDTIVRADFVASTGQAGEAAGQAQIAVTLSSPPSAAVTIPLIYSGTAGAPGDIVSLPQQVAFAQGQTSASILLEVVPDALYEGDEDLVVRLGAPNGATLGTVVQHTLTIRDDDPVPTASFEVFRTVVEESAGSFGVRIVLSAVSGRDAIVPFTITGPASGPGDIVAPASPAVIPAGQPSVLLPVGLVVDNVAEAGETVTFLLNQPMTHAAPGAVLSHLVAIRDGLAGSVLLPPALNVDPPAMSFAATSIGTSSAAQQLVVWNPHSAPLTFLGFEAESGAVGGVQFSYPGGAPPVVLAPAQPMTVDVRFAPVTPGPRSVTFRVRQSIGGFPPSRVTIEGIALGAPGAEIVMNAADSPYVSPSRVYWSRDFGAVASEGYIYVAGEVHGTNDDPLYNASRWGQTVAYSLPLPNGAYDFRFHSWEPVAVVPGARVFDVSANGTPLFDDVDVQAAVGTRTAYVSDYARVNVQNGVLDLRFEASVARAIVSAIEVRSVALVSSPTTSLAFGTIDQGNFGSLDVELVNGGLAPALITSVQFIPGATGPASEFAVEVGGVTHAGGPNASNHPLDLPIPPGQSVFVPVLFTPTVHRDNALALRFHAASGESIEVAVTGTGGANAGWGFLHPVIDRDPPFIVDYDANGAENVALSSTESHTHEVGRNLVAREWRVNGAVVSTAPQTVVSLPVGSSAVALKVTDDSPTPAHATQSMNVDVYAPTAVPGVLVEYYDGSVVGEQFLLDNVPASANFVARQAGLHTPQIGTRIGTSNFSARVMVRWSARFDLASAATLTFTATGGVDRRVLVDGQLVSSPVALSAGSHSLEARFAVRDVNDMPLNLSVFEGSQLRLDIANSLNHNESQLRPVIHSMPTQGTDLGGNEIVIQGFGFFPAAQVVVNWGATSILPAQFVEFNSERIQFTSPPGSGPIQVSITTPNGTSDAVTFHYSPSGPIPIRWLVHSDREVAITDPTRAVFGPDGRLWVALIDGSLRAITYDDNWYATNVQYYTGVSALSNKDPLGIAFNPYDVYDPSDSTTLKVYVGHGELFQNGGLAFNEPSLFTGQVSILRGPDFGTPEPLITGLPVSNHDHGINGLDFDHNGDLLIACGGTTNAGVQWPLIGDVPESPLTGAVLKAFTSRPGFNGQVVYLDRTTGAVIDDQRFGQQAVLAPGIDIEVFAPGLRNPFDLVLHSSGNVFATDNGPNDPFGPASLSATTQGGNPHPGAPDELILVERGNYYGHPNRSRGVDDARQNVYRSDTAPSIAHVHTRPLASVASSTNGIEEYRSTAFNSQLRGQLVVMKWTSPGGMRMFQLTPDQRAVVNAQGSALQPANPGLDVVTAPGGALVSIDYSADRIRVQVPDDVAAVGLTPYDVFPARGPVTGGMPFVLGGSGFGTLANTSVSFGGASAVLTSVTPRRIRGIVPALPSGQIGPVTVTVSVGATFTTIPLGFNYLPAAAGLAPGFWLTGTPLPAALGEVTCLESNGMLYVFGQGDNRTFRFDVINGTWNSNLAQRPFPGNHHGGEVWNGKLYLIGGLDGSSPGRVQIYDIATNSWSAGAQMPWAAGSVVTALIQGRIYAAGGIVGSSTVSNLAVYDPALNAWTSLGSMPLGINHAAAATDGTRMFVFGGRQGPNVPQPGFVDVQVYHPATGTWQTSQAGQVAPMPLPRGGTGRAVFYRGEFFVFGGEDASVAFPEVQAYNPQANTWRRDANMPTARHGVFPVLFQDRIFVMGGGLNAGFGMSTVVEIFKRL